MENYFLLKSLTFILILCKWTWFSSASVFIATQCTWLANRPYCYALKYKCCSVLVLICCRRQGCPRENKISQTYLHSKVDIDMLYKEVRQQSIK